MLIRDAFLFLISKYGITYLSYYDFLLCFKKYNKIFVSIIVLALVMISSVFTGFCPVYFILSKVLLKK